MNQSPVLSANLRKAANAIRLGQRAATRPVARAAYSVAREALLQALAIAKTLGLGSVVARVLLAIREVAKAHRQVAVA